MNRPSGDQKGKYAPSVPSSFLAVRSPRACTQTESRSFSVRAQKARAVPSGVSTGGPEKSPVKSNPMSAGGGKNDRSIGAGAGCRSPNQTTAATSTTIATAHSERSIHLPRADAAAKDAALGSFAKQSCTTWSSATGAIGCTLVTASGSFSRIADATEI